MTRRELFGTLSAVLALPWAAKAVSQLPFRGKKVVVSSREWVQPLRISRWFVQARPNLPPGTYNVIANYLPGPFPEERILLVHETQGAYWAPRDLPKLEVGQTVIAYDRTIPTSSSVGRAPA
jgi:hypothetical protein